MLKKSELMFDRAYVNERWDRYDNGRRWLVLVHHVLRLVRLDVTGDFLDAQRGPISKDAFESGRNGSWAMYTSATIETKPRLWTKSS
jgi:hypothetical protein